MTRSSLPKTMFMHRRFFPNRRALFHLQILEEAILSMEVSYNVEYLVFAFVCADGCFFLAVELCQLTKS